MDLKELLPILTIVGLVITWVYNYFAYIIKIKEEIAQTNDEITKSLSIIQQAHNKEIQDLSISIADIRVKVDLTWKCIEGKVIDLLKTFPTQLDKDILLDKMKEISLSLEDAERLRTLLDCELINAKDNKFIYILILARLEQIIYDLRKDQVVNNAGGIDAGVRY